MVDLVKEISNLERKQKPVRRPTWIEVLGEEKIEALNSAIMSWFNQSGVSVVFTTRKDLYDYLMGNHLYYSRERFFDRESFPDYRRFSEYMNEYRKRVTIAATEEDRVTGNRKGSTTK